MSTASSRVALSPRSASAASRLGLAGCLAPKISLRRPRPGSLIGEALIHEQPGSPVETSEAARVSPHRWNLGDIGSHVAIVCVKLIPNE
ncbi:hypothetical protein FKP32DRAFT_1597538 [Trametes sanguinea]|nr:hypothetical protein FKP32DRAFT_1597538 [Trametes sanguinea]